MADQSESDDGTVDPREADRGAEDDDGSDGDRHNDEDVGGNGHYGETPGAERGRDSRPSSDERTELTDRLLEGFRAEGATVVSADGESRETENPADRDRGRRLYDWWSDRELLYDGVMRLTTSMREETFDALALERGETVLDLACGPGINFERLRDDVGSQGTVIGLDYSQGMTDRSVALVDEMAWSNVHVVRADATQTCGPETSFDAAVVTFALHTIADAAAVVDHVHDALVPGGRFVVLDSRPIRDGLVRHLNPLYERFTAWAVNHQRGLDTLPLLEERLQRVRVVETYDAGAGYLAVAQKAPEE